MVVSIFKKKFFIGAHMKSFMQSKEQGESAWRWHVVDAAGVPLGRLASEVATLIRGKHKATFTPHSDGGDFVIVINAAQIVLTGNKLTGKTYWSHTGYMGGIKGVQAKKLLEENPQRVIELAVRGMLPKGPLGRRLHHKLKIYSGAEHPHSAQQPVPYSVKSIPGKKVSGTAVAAAA